MAISQYAFYKYSAARVLLKRGTVTLDSETGAYTYVDAEATITQAEVGTTQIIVASPDNTYGAAYYPFVTIQTPYNWNSGLLAMSYADITVIEDSVEKVYQSATIDLSLIGMTRYGGIHAFVVGYIGNGTYTPVMKETYTVEDGINNYENIDGDVYATIYAAIDATYAASVAALEISKLNVSAIVGTSAETPDKDTDVNSAAKSAELAATAAALKLSLTGGTMSGDIAMGTNKITGIGDGTANQDAVSKLQMETADAFKESLTNKKTDLTDTTSDTFYASVKAIVTALLLKADQDTTYTMTEVDNLVSSLYKAKGSVATYADLAAKEATAVAGDVWNVTNDETTGGTSVNYLWTGEAWDNIGGLQNLATATANGLMSMGNFSKLFAFETADNYYNKTYIDALADYNGWTASLLTPTALGDTDTILTATLFAKDKLTFICKNTTTGEIDTDELVGAAIVTGAKLVFFDDVDVYLTVGATDTTFTVTGTYELIIYGFEVSQQVAENIEYDNTDSGLTAVNVKTAIDEVVAEKVDKDYSSYTEHTVLLEDDEMIIRSAGTTKKTKISTIRQYDKDIYEYGVRRVYSPTLQESSTLERVMKKNGVLYVGAATNLTFNIGIDGQYVNNSFDSIDIFKYDEVEVNGSTFIRYRKRFTKHEYVVDGETTYEYFWQCGTKLADYSTVVFDRTGAGEIDYAYIGKYMASDEAGVAKSKPDLYPKVSITRGNARISARKNDGDGTNTDSKYGLVDLPENYELMFVPNLIITATMNSQSILRGVVDLTFLGTAVADSTVDKTMIVSNAEATPFEVDMGVLVSTDGLMHTILSKTVDSPEDGQTTITFDGASFSALATHTADPRYYKTGFTRNVNASWGAYGANDGKHPIKTLGLEDLYGGAWEFRDGVKISNNYAWVNTDPSTYDDVASTAGDYASPYVKSSYENALANGYSKDMGVDSRYPFLMLPTVIGGDSGTYYADYYYQATGDRTVLLGGSWAVTSVAGLSCWALPYTLASTYNSVGFRLSYRP